jgi:hypothetical protein
VKAMKAREEVPPSHLSPYFERFPVLARMFETISARELRIEMHACQAGAEFRFLNTISGIPNRGYLRILFPMESKCLLFFHKKSLVPYSHDRFSYGGVVIDERSTSKFDDEDIREWIEFLWAGLQPKFRPKTLKKSFPYTVPED